MSRIGSGYLGSSELMNSGGGEFEIVPQPSDKKYLFYKFEFLSVVEQEVLVQINGGEPILLWNGYITTGKNDAEISSFKVLTPNVDFYWYGAF